MAKKSFHWASHAAKTHDHVSVIVEKNFSEVISKFSRPRCKFSEANDSVREVYATVLCQLREKYP